MLLKQLDKAVAENKAADLRSFAVVLTDDDEATDDGKATDDGEATDDGKATDDGEAIKAKLKEFVRKFEISDDVPLLIPEDPGRLKPYKIHPDAEVTLLLYRKYNVVGNFAFKAGELKEPDVKEIMAALPKIIPSAEELEKEAKERAEAEIKKKVEAELKMKAEAELQKKLEAAKQESK